MPEANSPNRYYDNTRVSCYRECPRKYYLRHVRHWRSDGTSAALIFGLAWHEAMDIVWSHLGKRTDNEVFQGAVAAFDGKWTDEGFPSMYDITPDQEKELAPRTPGTAMEMLSEYIEARKKFITENEVLACEQPFAVPLVQEDENLWYVGRLDKRMRLTSDNKVIVGEHKTTSLYSTTSGIQSRQLEEYSPNSQVDGYLHALHMLHGKQAKSVWVDLALVHKTVHNVFKFVPVDRDVTQLSAWLWETLEVVQDIEDDLIRLEEARDNKTAGSGDFLPAFRKNTNSCSGKYGRCPYADLCKFVANPEKRWPDDLSPPDGYIHDKWEPFNVLHLEQLGMQPEDGQEV